MTAFHLPTYVRFYYIYFCCYAKLVQDEKERPMNGFFQLRWCYVHCPA